MGGASSSEVFEGQNVWIIGASSGIGAGLAREFHRCGAKVIVSARRAEKLNVLIDELNQQSDENTPRVKAFPFDATDMHNSAKYVGEAIKLYGTVDVVVLCHGIGNRGTVAATDISVEKKLFDVNVFSYFSLTKAILPHFKEQNSGRVVVMSSVQGFFGIPERAPYAAAKHALHGYYESLHAEVSRENILVNIVCPGYVRTEISLNALTTSADTQHAQMDAATASGYDPVFFSRKAVKGLAKNSFYIVVAQPTARLAIFLHSYMPSILRKLLVKRYEKQNKNASQEPAPSLTESKTLIRIDET